MLTTLPRRYDRAIGHWEWVCDVLRPTQVVALQRTTAQILALTITALTRPVAAVVLD